jgi:transcription initiation factor IIE alpha subunit
MSNVKKNTSSSSICPKCSTDTSFEEQTILRSCPGCGLTYAVKQHPIAQTLQDIESVTNDLQQQLKAEIKKAMKNKTHDDFCNSSSSNNNPSE